MLSLVCLSIWLYQQKKISSLWMLKLHRVGEDRSRSYFCTLHFWFFTETKYAGQFSKVLRVIQFWCWPAQKLELYLHGMTGKTVRLHFPWQFRPHQETSNCWVSKIFKKLLYNATLILDYFQSTFLTLCWIMWHGFFKQSLHCLPLILLGKQISKPFNHCDWCNHS